MEWCSGKGAVCVTGGTGFIASCLITRLIEQGYAVRATVRSSPGEAIFLIFSISLTFFHMSCLENIRVKEYTIVLYIYIF
jgi:nucleoside-diphosphate-sugar epimerase